MKPSATHHRTLFAAALIICLLSGAPSAMAIYFWDNNGLSPNTNGVWDAATPQWAPDTNLTATPVVWDPTTAAAFPGGPSSISNLTITVNSTIACAGIFNGPNAAPGVTNLILNGSGALSLNAGIQGFFNGSNVYNTIIQIPISGTGGLENESAGSLYLSATNSYSGGTFLGTSAGFNFNNGFVFGTGLITNMVAQTLLATPGSNSLGVAFATNAITITNTVKTFGANGTMIMTGRTAAPVTFTGPWTLSGAAGVNATLDCRTIANSGGGTATWTISGPIGGSANLIKLNTAILSLSGANTYAGKTSISVGTIAVKSLNKVTVGTASSSLGHPTTAANGIISMGSAANTGTLIYLGTGETTDRIIEMAGTTGGATIQADGSGAVLLTNNFIATNFGIKVLTLQGTNTSTNTIAGRIVDSGTTTGVTKAGTGTWTLSGLNGYGGFTILSAGRLNLANASALGNGTFIISGAASFDNTAAADISLFNSMTLSNNPTYVGSLHNIEFDGNITLANGNRTITVTSNTLTFGLAVGEDATGGRSLTKAGAGTLVLRGSDTYTGNTTISAGTLRMIAAGKLTGGNYLGTIANSGTFDYASSVTQTLAGAISGTGTVIIDGPGGLISTATNTYTGATIIRGISNNAAAFLVLSNNGSIAGGSLTIGNGARLDFSGSTSNNLTLRSTASFTAYGSDTNAATILGAPGGTIDFGSRPIFLTYTPTSFNGDASHPSLNVSQSTLSLNGNAFTITNAAATPLGPGVYVVMQQTSGSVISNGFFAATVLGTGVTAGNSGYITVTGSAVNLVVGPTATFSTLTASQVVTYPAPASITLAGTLSGAGPVYPAPGELIGIGINGNIQTTAIAYSTGDFSVNYNLAGLPPSATPYVITYYYGGNGALAGSFANSTTLTFNKRPVAVFGSRLYDGTANVLAAVLSVTNTLGADVVTVASGTATLATPGPGLLPIASFGTLTLGGASASNYTFTGASGLVNIISTNTGFSIIAKGVDATGTNFYLTWQSTPGTNYQVLTTTNLSNSSVWANLGGPITAVSTTTSVTNPIVGPIKLFQVIIPAAVVNNTNAFSIIAKGIDVTGTNFYLTWQSTTGTNYQVVASTNLSNPLGWFSLGAPVTAVSGATSATNPATGPLKFFKVFSE